METSTTAGPGADPHPEPLAAHRLIPPWVFAKVGVRHPRSCASVHLHSHARVHPRVVGLPTINSLERAKTSCAVPPSAALAARPATPDAVNTSSRCWPVYPSISDAAAHPTPAPPAADRCCRDCSGADRACTPVAIDAAGLKQRLAGSFGKETPGQQGHGSTVSITPPDGAVSDPFGYRGRQPRPNP